MNEDYLLVPLKDGDSALPVYGASVPQFAFADISIPSGQFQTIKLDDSSRYESVPMRWVDDESVGSFDF